MMDEDDFAEMYYNQRERKSEMALVYIACLWIGLLGGVVGYALTRLVAG